MTQCSRCGNQMSARLSGLCDTCLAIGGNRKRQPTGEELRDEAMERVEQAAPTDWKAAAAQAVKDVARRLGQDGELISDHVWAELETLGWPGKPHEGRALGPVMRNAARDGLIRNSGRVTRTSQRLRHAAPVTVWVVL